MFGVKPPGADFSRLDPIVCREIAEGVERERRSFLDAKGLRDEIA